MVDIPRECEKVPKDQGNSEPIYIKLIQQNSIFLDKFRTLFEFIPVIQAD
jgi:hypothetical protein